MEPGGENSSDGSNVGYLFSFWSSSWEVRRDASVNFGAMHGRLAKPPYKDEQRRTR